VICFKCNKAGHFAAECRSSATNGTAKLNTLAQQVATQAKVIEKLKAISVGKRRSPESRQGRTNKRPKDEEITAWSSEEDDGSD
jgi:hypothetical protein